MATSTLTWDSCSRRGDSWVTTVLTATTIQEHYFDNMNLNLYCCFIVSYQVLDDLLDAFLGGLHTVLGSLQSDPLTVGSRTREANRYAAVLLCQLPQHLTSPTHKVTVVANIYYHAVLHHVVLEREDNRNVDKGDTEGSIKSLPFVFSFIHLKVSLIKRSIVINYQVFDQTFQLLLGLTNGLLLPYDRDQLLLCVIRRREDDPSARPVPHAANISPAAADQEFVILRFRLKLGCEVVDLLKT